MTAMISGILFTASSLHPSASPYAALPGPSVGGPWPPGINAPRAVTKEWFNTICPNPTVLTTESVIGNPIENLGTASCSHKPAEGYLDRLESSPHGHSYLNRPSSPSSAGQT
jgi:hypothetical protein